MKRVYSLLILIAIAMCTSKIPIFTKKIADEILMYNKIYMIYVEETSSPDVMNYFEEFCEDHLCTVLNKSSKEYKGFRTFISNDNERYFAILDGANKKKYVHPIINGLTSVDLRIFMSRFEHGKLQPFYASEPIQNNEHRVFRKIVGKDMAQFIDSQVPIKILFVYSETGYCDGCSKLYQIFAKMAKRMYDPVIFTFGVYDASKNDTPRLPDEPLGRTIIFNPDKTYQIFLFKAETDLHDKIIDLMFRYTQFTMRERVIMTEPSSNSYSIPIMKETNFEMKENQNLNGNAMDRQIQELLRNIEPPSKQETQKQFQYVFSNSFEL